ncbi:amino acid permease [Cetobacterium ceti]
MNMIALGGAIGTGLFLACGEAIATGGPGGTLVAYGLMGIVVYFLMASLGEMSSYLPVSGSFSVYATRYVDKALGFSLGWNYWFNWAITLSAELVASALVMQYWFPNTPAIAWSALFLGILFLLNYMSTRTYGEGEYIFSGIKVVAILIFLFIGFLIIIGVIGNQAPGINNWTIGKAPFVGGVSSIMNIFIIAGFSFQGTELIGIAAGESENPEKNVPKAIKSIFWRIIIFYIGTFIIIGFLIPYTDPNLLKAEMKDVIVSPFTLVFKRSGFYYAAGFVNAIILTAVLSAGNSGLYASTRMLHSLAEKGEAPKFFLTVNKCGVPVPALVATASMGLFAFLTSLVGNGIAYNYLINISGVSGFIAWIGIAVCHYRFRRAFVAQGHDLRELPYRAKWFPFGPIFAFIIFIVVILFQNYRAFLEPTIDWGDITSVYIGIPVFIVTYLGYKFIKRTKLIPLTEVNLSRETHTL